MLHLDQESLEKGTGPPWWDGTKVPDPDWDYLPHCLRQPHQNSLRESLQFYRSDPNKFSFRGPTPWARQLSIDDVWDHFINDPLTASHAFAFYKKGIDLQRWIHAERWVWSFKTMRSPTSPASRESILLTEAPGQGRIVVIRSCDREVFWIRESGQSSHTKSLVADNKEIVASGVTDLCLKVAAAYPYYDKTWPLWEIVDGGKQLK